MRRIASLFAACALIGACCSQTKPVIGISAAHGSTSSSVSDSYVEAVRNAGGIPVIIPFTTDSTRLCEALDLVDAVIMTGGEDVNPAYYGEEPIPQLGKVNEARDTFDIMFARTAYKRGLPMLCICRGEQALNVALGGSLWQDIPAQVDTILRHKQSERGSIATQTISIVPGSRLAEIVGCDTLAVNSMHHQAVKQIAPGLEVIATTCDGVVEAYQSIDSEQVLAVQFHPEAFAKSGIYPYLYIFEDLVRRARK